MDKPSNTSQTDFCEILIYVVIFVIVIGVLWFLNRKTPEKFTSEDNLNYLTGDDKTLTAMNQISINQGNYDVACNLSKNMTDTDKQMISDYKNKYYKMYAHQIECNNNSKVGCKKQCDETDLDSNNADFVSLNQLILEKNNNRSCSTCTQQPILSRAVGVQNILDQVSNFDNVSASFMNSQVKNQEGFNNISDELKEKDIELSKKKKVSFANVNNFANFNNYVNQNGVLETSVDKLAEIRTGTTGSATCGLKQFGQTIADVYDNLMSSPYTEYKKACNISKITGINEDMAYQDGEIYAHV